MSYERARFYSEFAKSERENGEAQWPLQFSFLRETGAAIKFLSLEPLLGPLENLCLDGIGWVIVGGESGPCARVMKSEWVISIRDQCVEAGVPFFFKQWGGVWKKKFGRTLEGKTWDQMPIRTRVESAVA